MEDRILLVDDDEELLDSYRRYFYHRLALDTCSNPLLAVERLKSAHFKVVMSDLKMPQVDGIRFLTIAREISPDTTRILLTGYADVNTAINAINEGQIYRFLTKPSPLETVESTLRAGIEYHDLMTAERILLEQTLNGSISMLSEILSMVNPIAFSRASRIKGLVKAIASRVSPTSTWQFELAASLSQIGYVAVPPQILEKLYQGTPISEKEKQIIASHPQTAKKLLENIPRLEGIIPMITNQQRRFDTYPTSAGNPKSETANLGAQILKVALDYDSLEETGLNPEEIQNRMGAQPGVYNPSLLNILREIIPALPSLERKRVFLQDLRGGMIVDEDLKTTDHLLLLRKGQEISDTVINRLKSIHHYSKIQEPFYVLVPREEPTLV